MGNEGSCTALGLKVWKAQVDRADKLFGALSSERLLQEIAPATAIISLASAPSWIRSPKPKRLQRPTF
jgi:hypothetical protein